MKLLVDALRGHVVRLATDPNGNHVVQVRKQPVPLPSSPPLPSRSPLFVSSPPLSSLYN